jgi:hypothetical protein
VKSSRFLYADLELLEAGTTGSGAARYFPEYRVPVAGSQKGPADFLRQLIGEPQNMESHHGGQYGFDLYLMPPRIVQLILALTCRHLSLCLPGVGETRGRARRSRGRESLCRRRHGPEEKLRLGELNLHDQRAAGGVGGQINPRV